MIKIPRQLRHGIEYFSRGIAFRRSLETKSGKRQLWVSPEASLVYWKPDGLNRDRSLHHFTSHYVKEGATVWDIGSNVGIFGFLAAAAAGKTGKVICIEPDPFLGNLILRSARISPAADAHLTLIPLAISSSIGYSDFIIPDRSRASNHLAANAGNSQAGNARHTQVTMTVTLDWLLTFTPAPDIVKMDIEGEEYQALSAAKTLLKSCRPVILLEVWESISESITQLFFENDYTLFNGEDIPALTLTQKATWTTLAIPSEQVINFKNTTASN